MNSRTRIKICGLINPDDVRCAVACGADAIGLVFHRPSVRFIDLQQARDLAAQIPAFVTLTALFLDEEPAWIEAVIDAVNPDLLQFHGRESATACDRYGRPYIKAISMGSQEDLSRYTDHYPNARGFLLDSHAAGRLGGSGDTFDWSLIPDQVDFPLILAGGLSPVNVAEAIAQVRPWAVDVSSGVESSRGIKSPELINQFCSEVLRVNCEKTRS